MTPTDHQIRSVQGWLELSNVEQAQAELRSWPESLQSSPETIRLWMQVAILQQNWADVQSHAIRLGAVIPADEEAAFYTAEALHQLGKHQEAMQSLSRSENAFPDRSVVFYTMARYACALKTPEPALASLGKAFSLRPGLRRKAMADPDLALVQPFLADDDDSFMAQYEPEL